MNLDFVDEESDAELAKNGPDLHTIILKISPRLDKNIVRIGMLGEFQHYFGIKDGAPSSLSNFECRFCQTTMGAAV